MQFLAISGSARAQSSNTALLRALQAAAAPAHRIILSDHLARLPIFSPDLEKPEPPQMVRDFARAVAQADGLIIASPEYVHAIPGGLKNAIDWMVSREEMIAKPIVLVHASHRGEDMLDQLRLVLATVSDRFNADLFLRFNLMKLTPDEVLRRLSADEDQAAMVGFLETFASYCAA
jgi:chromate reductase, NAD(P)H dehydrogenase (quinone)